MIYICNTGGKQLLLKKKKNPLSTIVTSLLSNCAIHRLAQQGPSWFKSIMYNKFHAEFAAKGPGHNPFWAAIR